MFFQYHSNIGKTGRLYDPFAHSPGVSHDCMESWCKHFHSAMKQMEEKKNGKNNYLNHLCVQTDSSESLKKNNQESLKNDSEK